MWESYAIAPRFGGRYNGSLGSPLGSPWPTQEGERVSVVSASCYELLGVPLDVSRTQLERAWNERRQEAFQQLGEIPQEDVDALVARLDEAFAILSDSSRAQIYGSYLEQTGTATSVTGPQVFGSLYERSSEEKAAVAEEKETLKLPFGGEALEMLAEVVMAAPAPGEEPRRDEVRRDEDMGGVPDELPPWMNRPTPTGEVSVSPPFPAEAREENFLSNLEIQQRLHGLHEHLAAADLIRKERNELLRQVVKTRAELEMRASAEADLRKSVSASDRSIEDLRRDLERQRMLAEEAEADLRDLQALQQRMGTELADARDAKDAAELTAKGARSDLETVRVRVAQLEERIGGQDALLEGEHKVAESLREELIEAEKRREDADAVATQARDAFRAIDAQIAERDGQIAELEGRLEAADSRAEDDRSARDEMAARLGEVEGRTEGLVTEGQDLRVALEDARAELGEARQRTEELASEGRLQIKRFSEVESSKESLESELETVRSTLEDTRRALELAHQEAERHEQRGDGLETELRDRDSRNDQQARLVEELQEELGSSRGKLEDVSESLELARSEIEGRVRRVRELEDADEVRLREFDQQRRSRDRLEVDLAVARKEAQRRSDQLVQAREEIRRQTEDYLALRRQMGQRQNEVERLRREVRGSDSRREHELQEARREFSRTTQDATGLRSELQRLREENTEQRDELRRLRADRSELEYQRDELTEVLEADAMNDDELDGAVDDIMSLVRS